MLTHEPSPTSPTAAAPTVRAQPIFMVGSIRSGTTLLRLMLDHHPQLSFQHESEFMFECTGPAGQEPALADFHAALDDNWIYHHSGLRVDRSLPYREAVDDLLWQKPRADGKPLCGATVHHHFWLIPRYYPGARYIHIVRDGRDVAASAVQMGVAGNLFFGADTWLTALDEWDRLRVTIPATNWIQVRFEDLVTDAESTLRRVCDFLGVPYSERMFDYTQRSTYEKPDASAAARWRKKSPAELSPVERKIARRLIEYGYPLSLPNPLPETASLRLAQRVDAAWRLARFRVKKYGLGLYAQRQLVKLAPRSAWHRRVVLACRAVDIAQIK